MHRSTFFFEVNEQNVSAAKELNLTSVFANFKKLTMENVKYIRDALGSKIEIYAEVGAFSGGDLLAKYPDARPVESMGKDTSKDWYVGLCPTHPGIRQECLDNVKKMLENDVDAVWLDFIRYPTKWEEPEPYILDTCYCDRCMKMFTEYIGEPIEGVGGEGTALENLALHIDGSYYHEWLEFKSEQIMSLVREVRRLIDASGKAVKLGFFAIPWEDKEHGAAIKRILGQDFGKFAEVVDVFSPMLYHKMCGKDVAWVKNMVDYFWHVGKPFLPLIQTEDKPSKITAEEFKQVLSAASAKPSMGVCVFFLDDLIKNPEKFAVAKEFFA